MTIYRPRRHRRRSLFLGTLALVASIGFGGVFFWAGVLLWSRGHIVQAIIAGVVASLAVIAAVATWNVLLFPRWPQ